MQAPANDPSAEHQQFFSGPFISHCLRSESFDLHFARAVRTALAIRDCGDATRRSVGEKTKMTFRDASGVYCYLALTFDTVLRLHERNVKRRSFLGNLQVETEGPESRRCKIRLENEKLVLLFDLVEERPYERFVLLSSDTFTL